VYRLAKLLSWGLLSLLLFSLSSAAPVSSSHENEVIYAAGWKDYVPGFSSKEDKTSHSKLKFLQISSVSSSSATVTWISESSNRGRIEYGSSSSDLTETVSEDQEGQIHSVRMTGLSTDQTVYYRVHSGDQISQVLSFKTASIAAGMPRTVYGALSENMISSVVPDVIVKLHLSGNNVISQPISVLSERGGVWLLNLGNLKSKTGEVFSYSPGMMANITVEGLDKRGQPAVLTSYQVRLTDEGNLSENPSDIDNLSNIPSSPSPHRYQRKQ